MTISPYCSPRTRVETNIKAISGTKFTRVRPGLGIGLWTSIRIPVKAILNIKSSLAKLYKVLWQYKKVIIIA